MLISRNLHMKSIEVPIKARSTPASLSFKGQTTKHTTVKWSIVQLRFQVTELILPPLKAVNVNLSGHFGTSIICRWEWEDTLSCLNNTQFMKDLSTDNYWQPTLYMASSTQNPNFDNTVAYFSKASQIDHFTVACLVVWPLNESEAGGDIVLIETFLLFLC